MKVLVICEGNPRNGTFVFEIHQSFVHEQIESLKKKGIETDLFLIQGKGFFGYLRNYLPLRKRLANDDIDIVHAHYGLAGLLAVMQRLSPVVITYHGSDVGDCKQNILSSIAGLFSKARIFVAAHLLRNLFVKKRKGNYIIPCGVDLDSFYPLQKPEARTRLKMDLTKKYVLFASSFSNPVKNCPLAKAAVDLLPGVELLELDGVKRVEVNLLLNAVDVLLMTSFREGSPMVIKEAMACNCPIVTTDVGDARQVIGTTQGCIVSSFEVHDIAKALDTVLSGGSRTNGRENVLTLGLPTVAEKIVQIYQSLNSRIV